jgi:hypothetical protein
VRIDRPTLLSSTRLCGPDRLRNDYNVSTGRAGESWRSIGSGFGIDAFSHRRPCDFMGASASGCKIGHKWQLSYLAPLPWQFASGPRSTPPPRPCSKSICRRACSERSPMADRSSITLPLSLCATPMLPGLANTARAGGQRSHGRSRSGMLRQLASSPLSIRIAF